MAPETNPQLNTTEFKVFVPQLRAGDNEAFTVTTMADLMLSQPPTVWLT